MDRDNVCNILERMALLLDLKGENPFKVRAYLAAVRGIETMAEDWNAMVSDGHLDRIPGVGKGIAETLATILKGETPLLLQELEKEFPSSLFDLLDLPGLGPKKVRTLYHDLQIASVQELKQACQDGRLQQVAGFGGKTTERLLSAIALREQSAGCFYPYQLDGEVEYLLRLLRDHPDVSQVSIAGEYRLGRELIRDLVIIVATKKPDDLTAFVLALPIVHKLLFKGAGAAHAILSSGIEMKLFAVANHEFPFALLWHTGSEKHVAHLQRRANSRGWRLDATALCVETTSASPPPPMEDESAIYEALGFPFIPAELREDMGEIEAAEQGKLPRLVDLPNLRGTFHCHTTESDGRHSMEALAEMAMQLGLQYLGISDHSKSSVQANGLSEDRLLTQTESIRKFNAQTEGFRLFAGVECDIMKDGSLDYEDEILSRLDFVVASVHSLFGLSKSAMTDRIVAAIYNPYVTMLGHPTGRLLNGRPAYEIEERAILKAAAETNTVIELNCSPQRMELDWRWWHEARDLGVQCSINTDAHRVEGLGMLWHGVRAARKGWLRREDVITCLPLGQIETRLQLKRPSPATSEG